MTICYLALGSNLGSPQRQLRLAVQVLRTSSYCNVLKVSRFYPSLALGHRAQPLFYNAVLCLKTSLNPLELLAYCQQIEKKFKRVRKKHWGARTLDIDILFYGTQYINHPKLVTPHPEMKLRDFVLVPLMEIAPHLDIFKNESPTSLLKQCESYII